MSLSLSERIKRILGRAEAPKGISVLSTEDYERGVRFVGKEQFVEEIGTLGGLSFEYKSKEYDKEKQTGYSNVIFEVSKQNLSPEAVKVLLGYYPGNISPDDFAQFDDSEELQDSVEIKSRDDLTKLLGRRTVIIIPVESKQRNDWVSFYEYNSKIHTNPIAIKRLRESGKVSFSIAVETYFGTSYLKIEGYKVL